MTTCTKSKKFQRMTKHFELLIFGYSLFFILQFLFYDNISDLFTLDTNEVMVMILGCVFITHLFFSQLY